MMKVKIGFFDSGLGGLGVVREVLPLIPTLEAYYLSDLAFCPYGEKSSQEIIDRCHFLTQKLLNYSPQLIVVACNTATAVAIDELRSCYPVPFVGVEPYLNFVHQFKENGRRPFRPVVLLTKASANSERFRNLQKKLKVENDLSVFPCEGLADLIENHLHEKEKECFQSKLQKILAPLQHQGFTHAILGCTHYPFIKNEIESLLGLECVAPEAHVAQRIFHLIHSAPVLEQKMKIPTLPPRPGIHLTQILPYLNFGSSQEDPHLLQKLQVFFPESAGKIAKIMNL
jgi:glutamate racemase